MNNLTINAITSEIDPFAVFGADEEDDDDDEESETLLVHSNDEPLTKKPTTLVATIKTTTTTTTNTALPLGEKLSKIPKLCPGIDVLHTMTDDEHHNPETSSTTSTCIIPWPEQRNNLTILIYVSSQIRLVQSLKQFGGSRGYIATETISPGTLVLIEQPIVSWSDDRYSNTHNNDENEKLLHILYHHILMNQSLSVNQKQEIIRDLEYFHPTKDVVDECLKQQQQQQQPQYDRESDQSSNNRTDEGQGIHPTTTMSADTVEQVYNMIQELHLQYGEDTHRDSKENSYDPTTNPSMPNHSSTGTKLFQQIRNALINQHFTNSDATSLSDFDMYRILLALRYNALQSGLYYYSAMFNHSDLYNCVKFIPTSTTTMTRPTNNPNNNSTSPSNLQYYSEIRTTRTVFKGEPLTISYIPNILSHASRRHYLWQQHRFDIGNTILNDKCILRKMEYIHNEFPILSNMNDYKETATYNIETAMTELEAMYHDIEHLLRQQQNQGKTNDETDLFQQAQELEQASLELCISAAKELLQNPFHILLIPCRRLHVDICCTMQQHYENQSLLLSFTDRMKLLSRLVLSAYQLRQLQIMLYGHDHFDIARTNLDLVHGIEELLSRSPKHLLNLSKQIPNLNDTTLGLMQLPTITHWSTLEYTLRKDYERIKALYPNNANDYINIKLT